MSGHVGKLVEQEARREIGEGERDARGMEKLSEIEGFVKDYERGVLKGAEEEEEEETFMVKQGFWGLEIESVEEKMNVVERIFARLALRTFTS
jgi:hypothetical protein